METTMFEQIELDCSGLSPEQVLEAARTSIAEHRLALLRGFPVDVEQYTRLLAHFGRLCPNYAAGSEKDAYTLHPAVNVVRCSAAAPGGDAQRVQEKAGSLPMHAGRSFAHRRAPFIAMCMAADGWTDFAPGSNGESLIVRWGDALAAVRERHPEHWAEDLRLLTSISISFPPSHLDEEPSTLPFLYVPGTARRTPVLDDVAARLPQNLGRLERAAEKLEAGERWLEAVRRFADAANDPAVKHRYTLGAGDVVLIDNERYGHGRMEVVGSRPGPDGRAITNSRTIWTVNVE
jgi:hypothetical protein